MATANSKLKIDYGFDSFGTSNVTGDFRVSGNVFFGGSIVSALTTTGDLIPSPTGLLLGNSTNRWTLLANSGNFTNTVTVTGATTLQDTLTVTKTISGGNTSITGFANATVSVNSALLTVGADFVANTTGAYHTGVVNAASFNATGLVANTTGVYHTGLVNAASFNATGYVANTTGVYHTGVINAASFTTTGLRANTTALVPTSNTILLGNSIGRFVLSANTINASGSITGGDGATITGQVNATTGFGSGTINATSNGLFASATTISVGNSSVNVAITPSTIELGTQFDANSTGLYHTGTVNAASYTTSGFVANTTAIAPTSNTILLGNTIGRFVLSANTIDASGLITGGTGATITGQVNASTGFGSGTINATSNGLIANSTTVTVGNSTVNVAITTAGITSSGGTGVNPSSNTVGTALGTTAQRWVINANTINATGLITASAGANIQGTANLVDVNISGNLTVSGTTTYINTTNLNVGDNIVTFNADLPGATAPTENAGIEVNRGSAANVSFLWNETSDSWTAGNTDITGYVNASVSVNSASYTVGANFIANSTAIIGTGYANVTTSVNSALFTVGANLIANTLGVYHTGIINAVSHTTSGFVANTTAIAPTSNTILLGNSIGRFVLSANTGDFSTSIGSGTINATSNGLFANSTTISLGNSSVNVAVTTAGITSSGGTGVNPSSNTVGTALGTTTQRWVLNANTGDFSTSVGVSTINATSNGIVANTTIITFGNSSVNVSINTSSVNVATYLSGAINATSNGLSASATAISLGNSSVNVAVTTAGITSSGGTGVNPSSNTVGTALGTTTQRWVITANSITTSGSGSVGTTLAAGNTTITGFVNATSTIQGGSSLAIAGALSGVTTAAMGNTTITGFANASVSVNSASLTVGTTFIANSTAVVFTTPLTANATTGTSGQALLSNGTVGSPYWGTVLTSIGSAYVQNTDSRTLSGNLVISGTYFNPSANTILLGNTTQRWVVSANTGDFSGLITGGAGATITGQVNASTGFGSGTINATSNGLFANSTTISLGNSTVNVAVTTAGITSSGGTGVNPSSNTVGTILGTSTQRWVLNANTINASGLITGGAGATVTGQVNASTGFGSGTINATSNGLFANATTISLGNSSVNVAVTPSTLSLGTQLSTNSTGLYHTGTVNAASYTVGTNFIANTTGAYHTGLINAASINIGSSGFIANSTAIVLAVPVTANASTGTAGQALLSNGTVGSPYWGTTGVTVTDDTTTIAARYLIFTSATSGSITNTNVSSTKLSFNPSTGILSATEFSATSDERLKSDITTIPNALDKVALLRGVNYTYNDTGKKSIGVIAQEIEKVFPEVVNENIDGYKSVNYGVIVGVLIEAIKELKQEIEELKNGNQS